MWLKLATSQGTKNGTSAQTDKLLKKYFTLDVCTWNVLAQCLVRSNLFPYAKSGTLRWHQRSDLIASRLRIMKPQLLCLQEVDDDSMGENSYSNFWNKLLGELGYDFTRVKRDTGRHGCLIAWLKSDLMSLRESKVDLDDGVHQIYPKSGNVALIVELRHKKSMLRFVAATTHLYWAPDGSSIRLRQLLHLRDALYTFSKCQQDDKLSNEMLPVLCCGDFNALPIHPEYHVLMGNFPLSESLLKEADRTPDAWKLVRNDKLATDEKKSVLEAHEALKPWRSLFSSYPQLDGDHYIDASSVEPMTTNHTEKFSGTLDYMFSIPLSQVKMEKTSTFLPSFNEKENNCYSVRAIAFEKIPSINEIGEFLPNAMHPSDHLPLRAQLEIQGIE